jgi:biopolymer transport protein ExbD
MTKGGLIIRLIDVAMIILFGFIAISDLKVRAQIKLPSPEEEPQPENQRDPILLFVRIGANGDVTILENETILSAPNDVQEIENLLTSRFEQLVEQGYEMIVLIEPDGDSPIQQTVDVLDICERHQIPKSLNYDSAAIEASF